MGKRLPYTPNSKIKAAIRKLWLQSRERAAAIKRDAYTCQRCGVKQSRAKGREVYVEVHHLNGIENWDKVYLTIRKHVLCSPDDMETLCKGCHGKEGGTDV